MKKLLLTSIFYISALVGASAQGTPLGYNSCLGTLTQNQCILKPAAGQLYFVNVFSTAAVYVYVLDQGTTYVNGPAPIVQILGLISANSSFNLSFIDDALSTNNGILVVCGNGAAAQVTNITLSSTCFISGATR